MKASRIGGLVGRLRGRVGNHRGMVLTLALLVLVVLSGFGVALLSLSQTDVQVGRSQHESMQALYVADAAVERARGELNRRLLNPGAYAGQPVPKADFDKELDVDANLTYDGWLYGSASTFENLDSNGSTVGQFRVQVVNNCGAACGFGAEPNPDGGTAINDVDRGVYVVATGRRTFLGHTVQRRVEAFLSPSDLAAFTMGCGNAGEQDLAISGNPVIGGSQGSVHSNCNFTASGNYSISQDLSAVGTITNTGATWTVSGDMTPGADPRTIPAIVPTEYKNSLYMKIGDYIMRETTAPLRARIYQVNGFDASGNPTVSGFPVWTAHDGTSSTGAWPSGAGGWEFSGAPGATGTWQYSGSSVPPQLQNKTFYFEKVPALPANGTSGNVKISSSPGSVATPWKFSVIAEGHIDLSGNPVAEPADSARNVQIIAGTDIKFGGTFSSTWVGGGVVAAHEQVDISGDPTITGLFMVENAENNDPFLSVVDISGNPTITYSGAPPPPVAWNMGLIRITWRELP